MTPKLIRRSAVALAFVVALSACGGGGSDPPASFTVSASVSGLTGTGLVLKNNGGNDLTVSGNGAATFTNAVASGAVYSVTVATQPSAPAQTCTVTNGTGTVANASVSNVAVNCVLNSPDAPVVTLSSNTKRHSLQWTRPARVSFYRVYKTRSTDTDYQLISGDLVAETFDSPVAVHLEDWAHLRYRVDACNATGCTASLPSVPASNAPLIGYFKGQDSAPNDFFGSSTAISADGNTVAIGAIGVDTPSTDGSGAVYVYVRDSGQDTWVQQAVLKPSPADNFWQFGGAVALSADGSTLAVGAAKPGSPQPGAVYIYTRNASTWTEQTILQASNATPGDRFGTAVAISGDGNTVVASTPYEDSSATGVSAVAAIDTNALDSGAAYVFTRAAGVWTQQVYIKASDTFQGDRFGTTVAIAADGGSLAIGAPREDSGAIGVNGDQNNFGGVDTGAVYVFQRSGNTWVQEAFVKSPYPDPDGGAPGYEFGGSALALSGDGTTLAVTSVLEASNARGIGGDPTNMTMVASGAAYVYVRAGGSWTHQAYVKASNTDSNDQFGASVAFSDDGNIMAIGAIGESSRAVGVGGDQDDDAAENTGAVYVFRRSGSSWAQANYVHARSTDAQDRFGTSVALSAEGTTIVVGANFEDGGGNFFNADADDETAMAAGAAYIF